MTPLLSAIPKYSVTLGALKSRPNNNTFLLAKDKAAAKLIEIKDFPSPPDVDVTKITFPKPSFLAGNIKSKLVRIKRKASAVLVLESFSITIFSSVSERGTSPRKGTDVKSSISLLEWIFVSNKFFT